MGEKQAHYEQYLVQFLKSPLPLTPDNFTPLLRTPWGGRYITEHLKNNVCPERMGDRVGESWDFSCEPSFPSKILGSPVTLKELIAKYPQELLSTPYAEKKSSCEILVKILNTADDLSLQVHPSDDDVHLKFDEAGKFESWFILHAEEGAGIYLGFKAGTTKNQIAEILENNQDLRPYLEFHKVKAGDYFEIPPGTCHALGKGVVVLEPQFIAAGKIGKTYRLYDWDRRYNEKGELDIKGKPRELHVNQAMHLIHPETQSGESFLSKLRGSLHLNTLSEGLSVESFGSNTFYKCHRVNLKSKEILRMNVEDGFGALIPIEGYFAMRNKTKTETYWQKGQPGFLPSACFPLEFEAFEDTVLFVVTPSSAKESWGCARES